MKIAAHLLTGENPPQTLQDWYSRSTKYENNLTLADAIMGKSRQLSTTNYLAGNTGPPQKDPNAMEVDAISTNVPFFLKRKIQDERRKLGLCMNCGKGKHLARECKSTATFEKADNRRVFSSSSASPSSSFSSDRREWRRPNPGMNSKDATKYLREMITGMEEEEVKKFFTDIKTADF